MHFSKQNGIEQNDGTSLLNDNRWYTVTKSMLMRHKPGHSAVGFLQPAFVVVRGVSFLFRCGLWTHLSSAKEIALSYTVQYVNTKNTYHNKHTGTGKAHCINRSHSRIHHIAHKSRWWWDVGILLSLLLMLLLLFKKKYQLLLACRGFCNWCRLAFISYTMSTPRMYHARQMDIVKWRYGMDQNVSIVNVQIHSTTVVVYNLFCDMVVIMTMIMATGDGCWHKIRVCNSDDPPEAYEKRIL